MNTDLEKVNPKDGITSIGPGLKREFAFVFQLTEGTWQFNLWHNSTTGRKALELGPFKFDFESIPDL